VPHDVEKADLIWRFYAAFEDEGYESRLRTYLRSDVRWHVAGANPLAGDFVGVDEVLAAMRRYGEHSNHTLRLDTRTVFADGDHVVAIHWATARRPGFDYAAHEIDVFHVEQELICEFWSFSEDQAATDTLWS
jgi:uncharacterized protein